MQTPIRASVRGLIASAVLLVVMASPAAGAQDLAKPMALQRIMKQLDHDMQAVTAAIGVEDWDRVRALAPRIGRHDEPPTSEKLRILAWLGADAVEFRGFDTQVQEAAVGLAEAAARGDGAAVIAAFARVQQGCLACHQTFRRPYRTHFYDKR